MKRMRLTSAGLLGAVAVGCGLLVALGPSATATPTPSVQVVVAKRPALDATLPRFTVTLPDIPAGKLAIADVAVASRDEVLQLERAGFDAVLIPNGSVRELVGTALPDV